MAWIKLYQSAYTHRKTYRLAKAMKWDPCETVGRLSAMWCWAMDNASDGFIPAEDADALLYTMGKPTEEDLIPAMVAAGFLSEVAGGYALVNWEEYGGKLAAARAGEVEKKRRQRGAGTLADVPGDGGKCPGAVPGDGGSREDKSREEEIREDGADTSKPAGAGVLFLNGLPPPRTPEQDFGEWWKAYPRKENKGKAMKCYLAKRKAKIPAEVLLLGAQKYAAEARRAGTQTVYLQLPTTFLAADSTFAEECAIAAPRQADNRDRRADPVEERVPNDV